MLFIESSYLLPFILIYHHNYFHYSSYLYLYLKFLYHRTQWNQTFYTYICDYTLDPIWLEQRFVYDVPELAINEPRRFNVRVIIKARSLVGIDPILGKTAIIILLFSLYLNVSVFFEIIILVNILS
jgi:hypothetical protein